jgi:hypothetical protein
MTRVVRSVPQCPAKNPMVNHTTTSILDPIALHERPTEPFRMRVWSNTSCLYNVQWNKGRETQIGSHNKYARGRGFDSRSRLLFVVQLCLTSVSLPLDQVPPRWPTCPNKTILHIMSTMCTIKCFADHLIFCICTQHCDIILLPQGPYITLNGHSMQIAISQALSSLHNQILFAKDFLKTCFPIDTANCDQKLPRHDVWHGTIQIFHQLFCSDRGATSSIWLLYTPSN